MPVQNKPIIHGRDHETDGADPLRGLLPATGGYPIEQDSLIGYWPLNDADEPAQDHSGSGHHLDEAPASTITWGQAGPFDEPQFGSILTNSTSGFTAFGDRLLDNVSPNTLYHHTGVDPYTWMIFAKPSGFPTSGSGKKAGLMTVYSPPSAEVMAITVTDTGNVQLYRAGGEYVSAAPLILDTWSHVAMRYDGTTISVYLNGGLAGTWADTDSHSSSGQLILGSYEDAAGWVGNFKGNLSEAAIFNVALDPGIISAIANGPEADSGDVLIIDPETGEPGWGPPGTQVEHGDGDPEEDPVTNPPGAYAGTPENAGGWHLQAHFEYAVLYDSSPGRFDVPPRKWTRVPFNTVRLYRRWESTVDGNFVDAWLEDDRGLTEHAKNGTLLVTPGMLFNPSQMTVSGWFSIEYPMGDVTRMPGYGTVHGAAYTRGARMTNTSKGSVLKIGTGWGAYKGFFEWPFDAPDGSDAYAIGYLADNPYPHYLDWAARPLNKPLPYPKLSNAASLTGYQTPVAHEPGFRLDQMVSDAPLTAGDALSLQAWQDTPWLLRFGTDKYPPYTPYNFVQEWRKRPALVVFFYYDPDTVNHTTGALL